MTLSQRSPVLYKLSTLRKVIADRRSNLLQIAEVAKSGRQAFRTGLISRSRLSLDHGYRGRRTGRVAADPRYPRPLRHAQDELRTVKALNVPIPSIFISFK